MFDTHCHLNFQKLADKIGEILEKSKEAGVTHIVVPGTDVPTSEKAVAIAAAHENVYAAVGIHPHHVFELGMKNEELRMDESLKEIERLLENEKVVAVGEVGLDRHYYTKTRHENYDVTEEFVKTQRDMFKEHIRLALKYKKSLIIHHREAKTDLLEVLHEVWDESLERISVIHCCEPDRDLLAFAKKHNMFIGVDGDVTYDRKKQEFIKEVPLEMLVLETDAPFLIPEPYRSMPRDTRGPNVPAHLPLIAERVAKLKEYDIDEVKKTTFANALELFRLE
jgi:TatD DNase family protein